MPKIKRNDPCPCGSGKKYKNCCIDSIKNITNPESVNQDLYRFHQDLVSYTTTEYERELNEQIDLYSTSFSEESETREIYHTGLIPWIITSIACLEDNQTIFESVFQKKKQHFQPHTRELIKKWPNVPPSIYVVSPIDSSMKPFVKIKDLLSNKTFRVPYQQENDFSEGSLLIGILVPYADHHNFLFTVIKLFNRDKDSYTQLLQDFPTISGHFPDFYAKALTGQHENKWISPSQERVGQLFAEHMVDKNMNDSVINTGITLWNQYCTKENPTIHKIASYAAALDYLTQKVNGTNNEVKQSELAEEYGTSSSSVSTNYRKLANSLEKEI